MKKVITVETWRKTVLLRQRSKKIVWCEMCAVLVEMLSVDQAALISGSTELTVFRRVENGELHFTETPEGNLLICSGSLSIKNPD